MEQEQKTVPLGPIHQSEIKCAACARKWFFRYRMGLKPKVEPIKPAATIGKLYHRLMELGPDKGPEFVAHEVHDTLGDIQAKIDAGEDLTGELEYTAKEIEKAYEKALVMAKIWWERYPQSISTEIVCVEQKWSTEVKWKNCATCPAISIEGTIDEINRSKETGEVWIRDRKTSSEDFALLRAGYNWSIQLRLYRLLAATWLKNRNPESKGPVGFILDMVRTPTIRQKKKQTFEEYMKEVKEWYAEKVDQAMRSEAIIFSEPLFNNELLRALVAMANLRKRPPVASSYPRDITGRSCKAFKRRCLFYDLCDTDPVAWNTIIEQNFKIVSPEENKDTVEDEQDGNS